MAGGRFWTDDEARFVAQRVIEHRSNKEIIEEFHAQFPGKRSDSALRKARTECAKVREWIERLKSAPSKPSQDEVARHLSGEAVPGVYDERPEVEPDAKTTPYDPARVWERAKKETKTAIEFVESRHRATIRFQQSRPIGLTFISDQHISEGAAVDLERMEEDAGIVSRTPGLYAVLGGDGVDNHIKHRSAVIQSGSKPGREWLMYDHYLGMFGHSLAAVCSGNHDDWTRDFAGVDMVGNLAQRRRIFYAPDYVLLTVQISHPRSEQAEPTEYSVKVRHQYRYNSSFNQTHSIKRMWEMDDDDFDVGVVCHKHEAAFEPFRKHGRKRLAFRPGSYQRTTGHSRRYGYPMSYPTCPTAILFPGDYMMGFWDVREAASYLGYLRREWPESGQALGLAGAA